MTLVDPGVNAEVLLSPPTVESKVSMEPLHRPPLPPGVTERDLEMFKKAQEQAVQVSLNSKEKVWDVIMH